MLRTAPLHRTPLRRTGTLLRRTRLRARTPLARCGRIVYRPDALDAELDRLCGDLVKRLAGYRCERCGTSYPTRQGEHGRVLCEGLEWCHVISRRRRHVRWEPDNTFAACEACHDHLDQHPRAKTAFAIARVGQARFDELRTLSHAVGPEDRAAVRMMLRQRLEASA